MNSEDEVIQISDILVGEVWVCSGQSNMAMTVSRSLDADAMAKEAEGKKIQADSPVSCPGGWIRCSQKNGGCGMESAHT